MAGMTPQDQTNFEWAVGIFVTAGIAFWGLVFVLLRVMWDKITDVDKKVDESEEAAKKFAKDGDDKLWQSLSEKERDDRRFREKMIQQVGELPTKDDARAQEQRIMQAIQASARV